MNGKNGKIFERHYYPEVDFCGKVKDVPTSKGGQRRHAEDKNPEFARMRHEEKMYRQTEESLLWKSWTPATVDIDENPITQCVECSNFASADVYPEHKPTCGWLQYCGPDGKASFVHARPACSGYRSLERKKVKAA